MRYRSCAGQHSALLSILIGQLLFGLLPFGRPLSLCAALRLDDEDSHRRGNAAKLAPTGRLEAVVAGPMFGYSWLSAVHQLVNSLRHHLTSPTSLLVKPPNFKAATTPPPQQGTGGVATAADANATKQEQVRQLNELTAASLADDRYYESKVQAASAKALANETEQEDLEIVNDIQAMEWCMYPTFVLGFALVLTGAYSVFSGPSSTSASLVLAARFLGNLACSAIVLCLLAWAAQHHREDCERNVALIGMLAFFVEWMFIMSGAHARVFWWSGRGTQSGLDVLAENDHEPTTPAARSYTFRPRSVYLNGLRPLAELYARFTIQSLLMWLYVSGVHKKARELLADAASGRDIVATRVFVWWLLSAGVQLHMTEQMGAGFVDNLNVWMRLCRGAREGKFLRHEEGDSSSQHRVASEPMKLRLEEVVLRMCMDFVSNLMYYNLMYISVPVLIVASKQPIELVMNAFAVTYVLTLDDEKDQRNIILVHSAKDKDFDSSIFFSKA
eukprot:TRINITY_DN43503_c0_g2_i1.p1 TRINITY_DN43503_c0_g2~~TRINITY_DN43503_c0_g2_i1.p1  ORF type:complete len:501 (-),score=83.34 TRINITY_DN43503_c0_g2_i1:196-1698(-)